MTEQTDSNPKPVNQWTAARSKNHAPSKGLSQAYDLRQLAYEALMKFKDFVPNDDGQDNSAREIASLIRAWSEADDHVRIHRNKPLPGSLRPVAKVKRSAKTRLEPSPIPQEPLAPVSQAPV